MGNGFIALLAALGSGTWAYSKTNRRSGGANPKAAAIVAAVVAVIAFIIVFSLISTLDNFLN